MSTAPALERIVAEIATGHVIDPSTETIDGEGAAATTVTHWRTLLSAFTFLGNHNAFLIGNPGTAKTTLAEVLAAKLTGLPLDLYSSQKLQGHGDHTVDTMLGRFDVLSLSESSETRPDSERVIWEPRLFLPAFIADEINRLPPGQQNPLLEFIRTGQLTLYGQPFLRDKQAFFATRNFNGDGTHPLSPALLDRFEISLEFPKGRFHWGDDIEAAQKNNAALKDRARTKGIITRLLNKRAPYEERITFIDDEIAKSAPKTLLAERDALLERAERTPLSIPARLFEAAVWEEMNSTACKGENRAGPGDEAERDATTHNAPFASAAVYGGLSARWRESTRLYARMLAAYLGAERVELGHLRAIAPYTAAHRLSFHNDYAAKFADAIRLRGEHQALDLTRRLLDDIWTRYDAISGDLGCLDEYFASTIDPKRRTEKRIEQRARAIIDGPAADHPLLRAYVEGVAQAKRR